MALNTTTRTLSAMDPWWNQRACTQKAQIAAMSNLTSTLRDLGQLDEVAKMKEVLEKRRRILSEEHADTMNRSIRTVPSDSISHRLRGGRLSDFDLANC